MTQSPSLMSWQDWEQSHPSQAIQATTPRLNKYIPHYPTLKQTVFLLCNHVREVMFGGSAGGGKSDALLMAALQFVDMPNYHALILRRTFADLSLQGAIMTRAKEWLFKHSDVHWSEQSKTFTFPSGSTLSFGYLEHDNDKYRYQSSEYQFIAFDELTQFTESQYLYMFSRLRKSDDSNIPLRVRSASNPGNIGHLWVKARFITPKDPNPLLRMFIPSRLSDNPHINQAEYLLSLSELDMITRARLQDGDWDIDESGGIFRREWFEVVDNVPDIRQYVRYWDLAGTPVSDTNKDPDYSVGLLLGRDSAGVMYVLSVVRIRDSSAKVEQLAQHTAMVDGRHIPVVIEQEPGSSGKALIDHYQLRVLSGYTVKGDRKTGDKAARAKPVSAIAERGNIKLIRANWNTEFLEELNSFTGDGKLHDDQVDALSGAFDQLRFDYSNLKVLQG